MAANFVIYEKTTGRVEALFSCPAGAIEANFAAITGGNYAEYAYVMNRAIDPRTEYINVDSLTRENLPRLPFDLTIAPLEVSGVPEGAQITFLADRSRVTMDGSGVLELDVDFPEATEAVRLHLSHPHYLDTEIAVPCA